VTGRFHKFFTKDHARQHAKGRWSMKNLRHLANVEVWKHIDLRINMHIQCGVDYELLKSKMVKACHHYQNEKNKFDGPRKLTD